MRIIDGREQDGRVDTLVELVDLVELTPDGFRPLHAQTVEAIAARLRAASGERQPSLFGAR